MKKKILLFIDGLGSGGAQRQLVNLAIGLMEYEYSVNICYYHNENFYKHVLDKSAVSHEWLPRGMTIFSKILFPLKLKRYILKNQYTHVISFLEGPCFYMEYARLLGNFKFKLIVSERFMTPDKPGFKNYFLYLHHLVASHLTTNSYHQLSRIKKNYPWMANKSSTIYNGYDSAMKFNTNKALVKNKNLSFLVVSSLARKKNPINLIRAIRLVKKAGYGVNLRWAGRLEFVTGNNDSDRLLLDECNKLICEYGLEDDFTFVGEVSNIENEYLKADWLIHPSFSEGLPNAICESIAYQLPILASNVCDHKRLVFDSGCGEIFDPLDVEDISRAIKNSFSCTVSDYDGYKMSCLNFFNNELTRSNYAMSYCNLITNLK